jgi:hypothetical protein
MQAARLFAPLALACALAAPALAQADLGVGAADGVPPINLVPHGASDSVAADMAVALRIQQHQRDLCWELGCLVILNESRSFEVTGFYVAEGEANGRTRWSHNQFGMALQPRRATFRFKTGEKDCKRAVRFTARNPNTKEKVSIEGVADLCTTPHMDSVMRINVNHPEVIVGS